ncbi:MULTISPECIES: chorismate mutase [Paenibacillus]|uniref:chorismate mutase n=1 Tax=Paenibacillus alvei TaxID=44250 RepID=A0AAP6ZQW3_PAEAL|nr:MULTISPECIES: chorismate mutase [Paenibacillus]MBG9736042.1 chorismate mutase [Paenibacillus alvei]MBG9743343.1 chorismate mutase [Paenibacillus alvei]MCY7487297.1 chorismate mutase [Paenibacillus alvei]MCY9579388.1 chorismate mutase [Paenibacillus alvei]MCY9586038.1 chorismate mutase [Paenibacillus alvei]
MYARGIRGATTVSRNDAEEILQSTTLLLEQIVEQNDVQPEQIANIWITMTEDLNATFPARAIRAMKGWDLVPLMCAVEIPVKGSLPLCIRLMVTINTDKEQHEIRHVYLNEAIGLRPDLAGS